MERSSFQVFEETFKTTMKVFAVVLACFVAAAAANDIVVGYDLDDHEHTQKGQAGTAVTGSYSFTAADGVEHVVTYIADDKGYRVVGDATIESAPRPTTPRPTPAPTRAPTAPPSSKPKLLSRLCPFTPSQCNTSSSLSLLNFPRHTALPRPTMDTATMPLPESAAAVNRKSLDTTVPVTL